MFLSGSPDPQSSTMNPVYSPVQPGAPYGNPKNMAYTGYPTAYPAAAPAYNPSLYPTNSPSYAPEFQFLHSAYATLLMKQAWPQNSSSCGTEGTFHLPVDTGTENRTYQASSAAFRYTAGTPYKVPPTQSNTAPPPYSPSPNPYQTAMYPIRSAYPQQNLYAQGAYYTQPVYAAQPHDQRCGHGHGGWHHHGNVSRYPADCTPAYRDWGTPCLHANIQGPGDPCVQLCAPALVKPAAHPNLESHIVCNYSSLTQVLEPSLAAPPLFARRDNRSARVTLCIFNGFGF
ncbi:Protein FAM168A [Manis javanica]|nr:Protein FAM168A [Manis javanica]